ncbi:preprotein translocase subunit SecE [Pseudolysobacter antarcticus]|uniref:Protein translocase subunit SecE n=1 Tax=Pseudolysobacter antarcticus TaxID=2511995 RepID=A0A411HME5_9GAMM|nr:preprotein translocase subunit SecE [Pseudolysobacter antarcticus]QBB71584.1 preprotein translocase subunit SecE [Pseudolysobacter antarcticus]
MNTKATQATVATSADFAKLSLAIIVLLAGVVGYYWFNDGSPALRVVGLLAAFVIAAIIANFTPQGRNLRSFLGEAQFELRKVVWPTREVTIRTTGIIMLVVVVLSLLLGLIDLTLKWVIFDLLLKIGH